MAPSASNRQNWEFVFVGDPNLKRSLVPACYHQSFVGECTYFIAAVADPGLKWHQVDITIGLTNFTLQATELGYGTCWIGAFSEAMVKELLGVPEGKKVGLEFETGKGRVKVDGGEVVWSKEFEPISIDGTSPGMGVRFDTMNEASQANISGFIEEALDGDQKPEQAPPPL